jgi:CHAT domain
MTEREPPLNNVFMMEEPAVGLGFSLTKEVRTNERQFNVEWDRRRAKLLYTIRSPDTSEYSEVISCLENPEQINQFWEELACILTDAIPPIGNPTHTAQRNILFNLRGLGQELFNQLVPPTVANHIQAWQPGLSVRISTNEPWIPWELMYDGQYFLGEKFLFIRLPRLDNSQHLPQRSRPQHQGAKQVKKIVNVVGGNIKPHEEAQRASDLFSQLPESIFTTCLIEKSFSELEASLNEADILHFTCHGHIKPRHLLQISSDPFLSRENISSYNISQLTLKPGSFVFANACNSNTPVYFLNNFTSFAWEFYKQGADIFIGTLGTIPTQYAINFAHTVYQELLLRDDRRTVPQAIDKAKKVAKDDDNNYFWLLYCIYGNPDFCFDPVD